MRNKLFAGGLILFGFGQLWGWALTGDRLEAKMKGNQRLLNDIITRQASELAATRDLLLNRSEPVSVTTSDEPKLTVVGKTHEGRIAYSDADVETHKEIQTTEDKPVDESPEETRSRLQSLINQYTDDEDVIDGFTEKAQRLIDNNHTPPYVISKETYSWDEDGEGYTKSDVTWYPNERVLIDSEKDLIEDVDLLVGFKNLERFGDESDDMDVVFIRNDALMTDFEVIRETEEEVPIHLRYGMGKQEFEANKAADLIRFRPGDA